MALKDQLLISAVWTDSAARFTNTVGDPVLSAADNQSGELLSDVYTLVLSSVAGGAGGTGTVTVSTQSPNNPYNTRVVSGVNLNGTTQYKNIVPGLTIVFKNTAQSNGNTAVISVGDYLGSFDAFGVGAGTPQEETRHRVLNDGSGAVSDCEARLLPHAVYVKKTGQVFDILRPFAEGATEKIVGSGSSRVTYYRIAVSNTSGSGSGKTCDLSVDSAAFGASSIQDLQTGTLSNSTGLKAIGNYFYRVVSGPLTGLEFSIEATTANGDNCNVLIFTNRFTQIAPDVAGVAGTWGTSDVVLTQSGQAAGVIQSGGEAFYWTRIVVPAGANAESNPHPTNVALYGIETGQANYNG